MTIRSTRPTIPLAALLLVLLFVPTSIFYAGFATSAALGVTIASVIIFISVAAFPVDLGQNLAHAGKLVSVVLLVILLHLSIASTLRPVDFGHALSSFAPLLTIVAGGVALGTAVGSVTGCRVDRAIRIGLFALTIVAVLPLVGLDISLIYPGSGYARPFFPFTEPSHLALAALPLYLYVCVNADGRVRLLWLGSGLAFVLLLQSLTFGVGWIIALFVCTRGLFLPTAVSIVLAVGLTQLDLSYFLDRLDFSDTNQNLSTLVYLQGWEIASEAITATHWWGDGFQQLGLLGTNTPTSRLIFLLAGDDLNILDGGFIVAKLIGEFGVVGVGIVAFLTVPIGRSLIELRRAARGSEKMLPAMVFAHAVFAAYLVDLFVRGAGYFTASSLLLVMGARVRVSTVGTRPIGSIPRGGGELLVRP